MDFKARALNITGEAFTTGTCLLLKLSLFSVGPTSKNTCFCARIQWLTCCLLRSPLVTLFPLLVRTYCIKLLDDVYSSSKSNLGFLSPSMTISLTLLGGIHEHLPASEIPLFPTHTRTPVMPPSTAPLRGPPGQVRGFPRLCILRAPYGAKPQNQISQTNTQMHKNHSPFQGQRETISRTFPAVGALGVNLAQPNCG